MNPAKGVKDVTRRDGRGDFDFLFGTWTVANQYLRVFDEACEDWLTFPSRATVQPILGGLGNIDDFKAEQTPDLPAWGGSTLRLYDPLDDVWRLWWASTKNPGHLEPPMEGRFSGGRGTFFGKEEVSGRLCQVRFIWTQPRPGAARWEQAFRFGEGTDWHTNWVMDFTRQ